MKNNFWYKLKAKNKPILALAPMAGFTDSAFRRLCKSFGADVLYSEMASVTALHFGFKDEGTSGAKRKRDNGSEATLEILKFRPRQEKYYVVQLFGSNPVHFASAAKIITEKVKPDGIDINFGCPAGKVLKQGAGADLMKDLKRSRQVAMAVLENTDLPVSIKIRAKAGEVGALEFLDNLSDLPISALMVHGRTLSQGFAGAPDFDLVRQARQHFQGVILANGGINNLEDAKKALAASQADGLGLARGILGRPWLFAEIKSGQEKELAWSEIWRLMIKQAAWAEKDKGPKALVELRKHLVWYTQGRPGASRLRSELVKISSLAELRRLAKKSLMELKY